MLVATNLFVLYIYSIMSYIYTYIHNLYICIFSYSFTMLMLMSTYFYLNKNIMDITNALFLEQDLPQFSAVPCIFKGVNPRGISFRFNNSDEKQHCLHFVRSQPQALAQTPPIYSYFSRTYVRANEKNTHISANI